MANQAVHKRISNIEELLGRSHAILEERLMRLESLLLNDPARASADEAAMMWQLLYGAVARFGLNMGGGDEVAAIQLPLLAVPLSHRLVHQKDEVTGLVRISIAQIPAPGLTPPDVGEGQPTAEEAQQEIGHVDGPDVPTEPPSHGGFVIDDEPFVDEETLDADTVLEREMSTGVREE